MDIQWFPGHMTKTRRMIEADIKLIDCVLEIIDARCPKSSRNPDLPILAGGKPILTVMNKCDIADKAAGEAWRERLGNVVCVSSKTGDGVDKITNKIRELTAEKAERDRARGIVNRAVRIMVCGIPNVGKSSLINRMAKKSAAKVGDRPGVTRGKQWVSIGKGIEMLDTPGILWPKFDDKEVALHLAFTGAIKDEILDAEGLACELIKLLSARYADSLAGRYSLTDLSKQPYEILTDIAKNRGFALSGGEFDTARAANILLDEFRAAKIGKITLDEI